MTPAEQRAMTLVHAVHNLARKLNGAIVRQIDSSDQVQ